jgi:small multidrug resistance pump/quaternary ammonium compound-resistance protein SugE
MYIVWVLAAAIFFTAGGVSMKASAGMTRATPTILLFLFFAVGATFQALALRRAELGVAYLVVLGLEAVLAVVLGAVIFSERLSALKCTGVLTVVLGLVLLHLGETRAAPAPTAQSAHASPD